MSLIERLEKQAKYHADKIWKGNMYYIYHEDERRLLQEAADRIKALSLMIEQQKQQQRA
jgi:hypothetical protein